MTPPYIISDSVVEQSTPLTFDQALDRIAELQKKKDEIKKQIDALKAPARTEMKARNLRSYTTPNGTKASLFESNNSNVDKVLAQQILDPEDFGRIWTISTSETFKVKG